MAILSSTSFEVVNAKTRKNKGPLVAVEIAPGRFVKMYRADAEAQGFLEPLPDAVTGKFTSEGPKDSGPKDSGAKGRPAEGNKMRPAGQDKEAPSADTAEGGDAGQQAPASTAENGGASVRDDFTVIEGVGPATARALAAAGIVTFEQLTAAAAVGGLEKVVASMTVREAIEKWLEADGE